MPNHVTNKIIFSSEHAETVFAVCCPDGKFDFNALIPEPPHLYRGDLSSEDEKDFPCNWLSWRRENWGTKWNAYDQSCGLDDNVELEDSFIQFDTAWSVPYPILAAFANRFDIPFEHRYYDEGHNFWGIERWNKESSGPGRRSCTVRVEKRKSLPEDQRALCLELKDFDLNETEE